MISVKLNVSMFWSILIDLVSNLAENLDVFSAHGRETPLMPCSWQDILGGFAWMNVMNSMLSRSLHILSWR